MTMLGIALIVIGLALVCGGLMSWPRASRTEEKEKTELRTEKKLEGGRASKTGSEADPVSATLTDASVDNHGMEDC